MIHSFYINHFTDFSINVVYSPSLYILTFSQAVLCDEAVGPALLVPVRDAAPLRVHDVLPVRRGSLLRLALALEQPGEWSNASTKKLNSSNDCYVRSLEIDLES